MKRGDDAVVLWPRYFDRRLSRAQGRRVSSSLAVRDPDAKWIHSAAKKAGLEAELEESATDPRVPYRSVGRVIIAGKGGKEATIRQVAKQMADTHVEPTRH